MSTRKENKKPKYKTTMVEMAVVEFHMSDEMFTLFKRMSKLTKLSVDVLIEHALVHHILKRHEDKLCKMIEKSSLTKS